MEKGDFVIWDSGWGYDVGYFVQDKGVMYHTNLLYMVTGVSEGNLSVAPHEIKPFDCQTINTLNRKYGYEYESRTYINLLTLLNNKKNLLHDTLQ